MHKVFLVSISAILLFSTIGASCVNDDFLVVLNLNPIVFKYRLPPGNDTTFAGTVVVRLDSLIGGQYSSSLRQARVYDIRVKVEGEYRGSISGLAQIKISTGPATNLVKFPASGSTNWSNFYTPQSLLGASPLIVPDVAGISQLLNALKVVPLPSITLLAAGKLNLAPVPDNLYVIIEVYLQADAELS